MISPFLLFVLLEFDSVIIIITIIPWILCIHAYYSVRLLSSPRQAFHHFIAVNPLWQSGGGSKCDGVSGRGSGGRASRLCAGKSRCCASPRLRGKASAVSRSEYILLCLPKFKKFPLVVLFTTLVQCSSLLILITRILIFRKKSVHIPINSF